MRISWRAFSRPALLCRVERTRRAASCLPFRGLVDAYIQFILFTFCVERRMLFKLDVFTIMKVLIDVTQST